MPTTTTTTLPTPVKPATPTPTTKKKFLLDIFFKFFFLLDIYQANPHPSFNPTSSDQIKLWRNSVQKIQQLTRQKHFAL
jgi:hypothetical protein